MLLGFRLLVTAYLCNIINSEKILNFRVSNDKDVIIESKNFRNPDLKHMKRLLVKRMVPHGYESRGLEYDNRFKTYYRPLVRFHKGQQIDIPIAYDERNDEVINNKNKVANKILLDDNELKQLGIALNILARLRKLMNTNLARSGWGFFEENGPIKKLYEKYKKIVFSFLDKQFGDDSEEKKNFVERALKQIKALNDKKDLIVTLGKAFKSLNSLRDGEEGVVNVTESIFAHLNEDQTEKPKVKLPYVPYWNYWTYEKTIHEDNCKHGWVRYHDMCLELPPS